VSKWTLDSLLKKRHELLVEKKAEAQPATGAFTPNPVDATLPPVPPGGEDGAE
jgi:hypothetical protein